jgi:hypothetical protein
MGFAFTISDSIRNEENNYHTTHVDQHMNYLQVFVGGTAFYEERGTYFSLGLDYVHVLITTRGWAAGVFAEVIFAKHPEWIFGLLLYRRVYDQFFIRTGPGIEILRHEEIDPECNCVHVNSETEFLYRIGFGYRYHKNSLVITPTVDVDLIRSETALVFGINIGFSF